MSYPFILTPSSAVIVIDSKTHTVEQSHPNFDSIVSALYDERWPDIPDLIDIPAAVSRYVSSDGRLTVEDGAVLYMGEYLDNRATDRLLSMMRQGWNVDPLINFLSNVCQNPDERVVNALYDWLERSKLPISEDGSIIAYKIVQADYTDVWTGTYDNSIGSVVEMPRFKVDSDPDRTCSSGLHFCSAEYLPHFGTSSCNRVVVLKVNPRDVVAFPNDYDIAKARCCRYEVLSEVPRATAAEFFGDAAVWTLASD